MKYSFTFPLLICIGSVYGQLTNIKCQPLIDAEHAFSVMAKDKNSREAFFTFLSDSAITFDKNGPRMGKDHLKHQEPNESLLSWDACYTDIAASGDWGFNIGPWYYRANKNDSVAVAFGHFVTVWTKEANGKWHALVDVGISHSKSERTDSLSNSKIASKSGDEKSVKEDAFAIEKKFIDAQYLNGVDQYLHAMSVEARLLRNGVLPLENREVIINYLKNAPGKTRFNFMGGRLAPSGDMMFVYGTAVVEVVKDGQLYNKRMNYVRIWKRENGTEWKLVVDILS